MFAHAVTAQAEAEGLDSLIRFSREQLPAIRQQPGFRGYYLLSDPQSGKLMTISLWETQEHQQAGAAQLRDRPPRRPQHSPESCPRATK